MEARSAAAADGGARKSGSNRPRRSDASKPPRKPSPAKPRSDIEPVAHETLDRVITGLVTLLPVLGLATAVWFAWSHALHWQDLVVFAILYVLTGFGVTVGFHRHLTHRAFKTSRPLRGLLAVLGSAAVEGPVIPWVANHRKHHRFSDEEGDPHSPHVGHAGGLWGALRGLFHAHLGWLFIHTQRGAKTRYTPDLLRDPTISFVDRTFFVWAVGGFVVAFGLGVAISGTVVGGLTALLWGGAVRVFLLHHVTYSINSLCHFFGTRPFPTGDESRNLAWLAPFSFGEAWHNNHHAFPTAAMQGLRRRQLDIAGLLIRALEALGLVWDVVRISPERQRAKAAQAAESA